MDVVLRCAFPVSRSWLQNTETMKRKSMDSMEMLLKCVVPLLYEMEVTRQPVQEHKACWYKDCKLEVDAGTLQELRGSLNARPDGCTKQGTEDSLVIAPSLTGHNVLQCVIILITPKAFPGGVLTEGSVAASPLHHR